VRTAALAPLLALAAVLLPALVSPSIACGSETRVWGFDFENASLVGVEGSQALESRRVYGLWYGGNASDSTLAPSRAGNVGGAQRLRALPEEPGVYHVEAKGEYYTGSGVDVRARMSSAKHPAADLIRDPNAKITVYPADISGAPATRAGVNRSPRVVEQDVMT
jgi:hypothetical protein